MRPKTIRLLLLGGLLLVVSPILVRTIGEWRARQFAEDVVRGFCADIANRDFRGASRWCADGILREEQDGWVVRMTNGDIDADAFASAEHLAAERNSLGLVVRFELPGRGFAIIEGDRIVAIKIP